MSVRLWRRVCEGSGSAPPYPTLIFQKVSEVFLITTEYSTPKYDSGFLTEGDQVVTPGLMMQFLGDRIAELRHKGHYQEADELFSLVDKFNTQNHKAYELELDIGKNDLSTRLFKESKMGLTQLFLKHIIRF